MKSKELILVKQVQLLRAAVQAEMKDSLGEYNEGAAARRSWADKAWQEFNDFSIKHMHIKHTVNVDEIVAKARELEKGKQNEDRSDKQQGSNGKG